MKTKINKNALEQARALTLPTRKASLNREPSVSHFWNSNRNLLENAWAEWEIENKGNILIPDEKLLDPRLRKAIEEFTGSQVDFHDKTTGKTEQTIFEPGKAILHRGNVPHATHPIISGQRSNLVVWLYGDHMKIPRGGSSSYGSVNNSESKDIKREKITPRQRWSLPEDPKDSLAPF